MSNKRKCPCCTESVPSNEWAAHCTTTKHVARHAEMLRELWLNPVHIIKSHLDFVVDHRRPLEAGITHWELEQHYYKKELQDKARELGIGAKERNGRLPLLFKAMLKKLNGADTEEFRHKPARELRVVPCVCAPIEATRAGVVSVSVSPASSPMRAGRSEPGPMQGSSSAQDVIPTLPTERTPKSVSKRARSPSSTKVEPSAEAEIMPTPSRTPKKNEDS
eukprot:PhM_4_TR11000/c0_g2_i1/m.80636